jgi:CPA1 family monovalent cation:H+ antiporter
MNAMEALELLVLPVGAIAVAAAARWRGWPVPLLLVLAGLLVSFVPGVPDYALDPEIVLLVFLPPLLYSAAQDSSYLRLRDVRRPVALLSVGLVLFSTVAIGLAAHALIPGLPLAAAFALGAIVSPPDAVAAVAVARRLGLPRRMITILVGESLFNDATALTVYRVAVAAALGEGVSLLGAIGRFLYAAGVGVLIGLAIAYLTGLLVDRIRDPLITNTISLVIPFVAYLAAEIAEASGVIAVVVVGLYLGYRMTRLSYGSRLVSHSVWKIIDFFLEIIVFALIGLQLRPILTDLTAESPAQLAMYAVVIFVVAVVARFAWTVPGALLPRALSRKIREREDAPTWRGLTVIGWAGMRGVVSLAAAFSIPEDFPRRNLLLFLTFVVVIGTLLVQGLSFPALIRRLGISAGREAYEDNLAEAAAQQAAASAALSRLDEIVADGVDDVHSEVVAQLRSGMERRSFAAWERLGSGTGPGGEETPTTVYRRLRREMLAAERQVFVRMRDERRIDDEVLRRVVQELDFEEAALSRD